MKDDLRRTAVHEAGHAVIGRVLGIVDGYATIQPDDDSSGHGICPDPWMILSRWQSLGFEIVGLRPYGTYESAVRARILAYMAGAEAEVAILGKCPGGDGDDRRQVLLMGEQIYIPGQLEPGDGAWERYEARLRSRCAGLVRRHRAAIERVADELLVSRTLCAGRIAYLMRPDVACVAAI